MEEKYTLDEVILEGMRIFQISAMIITFILVTNVFPKHFVKNLNHTLKKERPKDNPGKTFWDEAVDETIKKGNKKLFHYFTADRMKEIIYSDEIYNYLHKQKYNCSLPTAQELNEMIAESERNYVKFCKDHNFRVDHYVGEIPKEEELIQKSNAIMLTALYELFFEPLDLKLLYNDIYNESVYGGNSLTKEVILSQLRSKDYHNYIIPKKEIIDLFTKHHLS